MSRIANSSFVSKLIVPSQSLKDSICKVGANPKKVLILHSTIEKTCTSNPENECLPSRRSWGFRDNEFIVTYFGSPCTLRGTDTAILSMQKVVSVRSNVKLLLLSRRKNTDALGGNSHLKNEEDYLRKLIRQRGLDANVKVSSGVMSRNQLNDLLLISNVIVLPFKIVFSEPPLSLLEAMNLGKAVVTTNLGALAEIAGNGRGLLIEPSDVEALAQAILYLSDHPGETELIGKKAQYFASNLGDWNKIANEFEQILQGEIEN
jgi:glycosyltransferase involved in cell wall biosynthesis